MYQLIAFDLDETLLSPSGEITPRTRRALRDLNAHDVVVALASGRMLPTMLPVAEALGFAPALVSYNGAQVNLSPEEPPLYHCPVPAALAGQVIDYAQEHDLHLHFYHDNRLFATSVDNWKAQHYREQTGAIVEYEPDFDRFRGMEPTKLLIVDEPDRVEKMLLQCRALFGNEPTLTRSSRIYLEFLHPSVNKGAGFAALCRALEIPLQATAAFGDAYNDIEMLKIAGLGIAMGNAVPEARAVADRMCGSNADDGVAQVVEEWLLTEKKAVEEE